jgi:hypothetical protein
MNEDWRSLAVEDGVSSRHWAKNLKRIDDKVEDEDIFVLPWEAKCPVKISTKRAIR